MRDKRESVDYIRDIVDSIEKVERFTKDIPRTIKKRNPEIPWREMAGIRDKLVHEYFGVNLVVVWKAIQEDIPVLKPSMSRILENESRQ